MEEDTFILGIIKTTVYNETATIYILYIYIKLDGSFYGLVFICRFGIGRDTCSKSEVCLIQVQPTSEYSSRRPRCC